MITHEQPGTSFWDRVRAGAEQAAKNHNVELKYSGDPQQATQATQVQNAIDSKVDGIAATLAAPEAVGPMLKQAGEAGIPTVAFNAGIDTYQDYGALMYFGSDESLAGEAVGKRLSEEGGKKALCIVHAEGVSSLEARCAGVKKGFPNTENLQVNGADLAAATATIQAKLSQDKSITDIVTLDAGVATAVIAAKADRQRGQGRHLRPQPRGRQGHPGRHHRVLHRPAALPAGLPRGRLAVVEPHQRQRHRRRQAGPHRTVLRRRVQHRQDRRLRRQQHPLSGRSGGARRIAAPPCPHVTPLTTAKDLSTLTNRSHATSDATTAPASVPWRT